MAAKIASLGSWLLVLKVPHQNYVRSLVRRLISRRHPALNQVNLNSFP
ncbi:MAG TPA: hypothetical protein V6D14_29705 [Coleofasciculaceae cyanobacterium]